MRKTIKPRRPPGAARSLPKAWHNWALGVLCLATLAFAISSIGSSSSSSAATQRTATVSRSVVQSTVSGSGSLEAAKQVELNFGASGEITAVDVKAGEHVSKGQILARIDSSSARASLAQAEAQLAEAEETLETAEESGASTAFTTTATRDEARLASTDGAEAAGSSLLVAYVSDSKGGFETDAANPKSQAGATKGSGETGSDGEGTAKGKSGKSESASGTKGGGKTGDSGSVAPPTSSGEGSSTAPSNSSGSTESGAAGSSAAAPSVATAEANLREAQLSVKSARQEVRETTLRAPISGTIASISGSVGETVSGGSSSPARAADTSDPPSSPGPPAARIFELRLAGSAFMVIAQLHRLKMEVSFSESDIGKVRKGQTATVSIDSMEGTELAGEVTKLSVLPSEGSRAASSNTRRRSSSPRAPRACGRACRRAPKSWSNR